MYSVDIKKRLAEAYKSSTLQNLLDNAAQNALLSFLPTYAEARSRFEAMASTHGELTSYKVSEGLASLLKFHSALLDKIASRENSTIDESTIKQFYSLVYHLLPEGSEDRNAIEASFEAIEINPVLNQNETEKNLPAILSLTQQTLSR